MTLPRLAFLITATAGLGGLALGFVTAPGTKTSVVATPSGTAGKEQISAAKPSSVGGLLAFAHVASQETFARLLDVIRSGNHDDLMKALQEVVANPTLPPLEADLYRDALVERLARTGAAEEIVKSTQFSGADRQAVVSTAIRVLAESNPTAAETLARKLPPGEDRSTAFSALLTTLGQKNQVRGLALIDADPQMRASAGSLFFSWAKIAPEAAMEAAFSRGGEFEQAKRSAMSAWARKDPDAAWRWIAAQPPERRYLAQETYFSINAWENPSRALNDMATKPEFADVFQAQWIGMTIAKDAQGASAAVDRLPPGRGRTQLIGGLARALSGEPLEAIAWTKTLLPGERETAVKDLFSALGYSDPAAALDLATHGLDGPDRNRAIGQVISGWAQQDFDAAFSTMLEKLDPAALHEALPTVLRYHSGQEKDVLARQFSMIGKLDSARRAEVLRAWGENRGARGDTGIFDQLALLAPEDRVAFAEGVMQRSFEAPESTMTKVTAMLPPEKQAQFASQIADSMARTDLPSTAEFLSRLPETDHGGEKRGAMEHVVRDWTCQDPAAAQAFVSQLPAGETKDRMSRAAEQELRKFDLDGATQAAAAVANPQIRSELIKQLASDWQHVDAARGRAAMAPLLQTDADRALAASLFKQ